MDPQDDIDSGETGDWLDALKAVQVHRGAERSNCLHNRLVDAGRRDGAYVPRSLNTAYCNTIPPEREEKSSGDRAIEHRLRSIIRWNAQRERVLEFIAAHLHAGLSVERLATHVRMSPSRFARAFKASMGISPHRYVQQRRVEAAAHALRLTSAPPIVEIALAHGFSSQAHFTDVFRRHTGTTPARFRCMQVVTADSR